MLAQDMNLSDYRAYYLQFFFGYNTDNNKLNLKIKYRESFRPFAPSVLEENAKEYFEIDCKSPYNCSSNCTTRISGSRLYPDIFEYFLSG